GVASSRVKSPKVIWQAPWLALTPRALLGKNLRYPPGVPPHPAPLSIIGSNSGGSGNANGSPCRSHRNRMCPSQERYARLAHARASFAFSARTTRRITPANEEVGSDACSVFHSDLYCLTAVRAPFVGRSVTMLARS